MRGGDNRTGELFSYVVSGVPAAPLALGREGRCSKPMRASINGDFRAFA